MQAVLHLQYPWLMEGYAMASVRSRFDFGYLGTRCREQTTLEDTKTNRTKMEKILKKIEEDIDANTFEYRRYFPNSKLAAKFDSPQLGCLRR